jgi:N-acetylglucosaminyldiphosphoundecaprenol N-acetyl-beta-D-mannosaminyltransferase
MLPTVEGGPMTAYGERSAHIGAVTVDLLSRSAVLDRMRAALDGAAPPLALLSANLDHVHHFASRQRLPSGRHDGVDFVTLLDGRPLARAIRRRTKDANGTPAPLLPGSELLAPALQLAADRSGRVALVGASDATRSYWQRVLPHRQPGLTVATFAVAWADLDAPGGAERLAGQVATTRPHLLVVSLGKPRQELWLRDHVAATGCRLALAFGSAADYLAGTRRRPPALVRRFGLEWLLRLLREPRRLGHRYLVEGPAALRVVRRDLKVDNGAAQPQRTTPRST